MTTYCIRATRAIAAVQDKTPVSFDEDGFIVAKALMVGLTLSQVVTVQMRQIAAHLVQEIDVLFLCAPCRPRKTRKANHGGHHTLPSTTYRGRDSTKPSSEVRPNLTLFFRTNSTGDWHTCALDS